MAQLAALLLELMGEGPVTLSLNKDGSVTARCSPPGEKAFSEKHSDLIECIGNLHTEAGLKDDERTDDGEVSEGS